MNFKVEKLEAIVAPGFWSGVKKFGKAFNKAFWEVAWGNYAI
ncbi:hypothetical protein [Listeria valentina]|nr:hypothetical protein [Listeria valentina]